MLLSAINDYLVALINPSLSAIPCISFCFEPSQMLAMYDTYFLKENLLSEHYDWSNPAVYSGNPSRRLFSRYDGHQLLFIINSYASQEGGLTVEEGQKIESMISNQLPLDAKSELSVLKWLKENN